MAFRPGLIFPFLTVILVSLPWAASSRNNTGWDIQRWCGHTLYPKACNHHLILQANQLLSSENNHVDRMAVRAALDQALRAKDHHNKRLGLRLRGHRKRRAAWHDCAKLYDSAVLQLSTAMSANHSGPDVRTWLSAALTDLQTCRAGFDEIGHKNPKILRSLDRVSQLVSNSLAITSLMVNDSELESEFSSWVTVANKKHDILSANSLADVKADLVVALDGTGDFRTIKDGVEAAASRRRSGGAAGRLVIRVKEGVYRENVEVGFGLNGLVMVGDGIGKTVVTGSRSFGGGSSTYSSATFAVVATGFVARGMTFRNTAGPENHQAVALRSGADLSVFYQCSFEGYQDTLYVHSMRQFYRECDVYGTVDFIFGNAAAVFQDCNIYVRRPMSSQKNTVTAQGRTDPNQNTGISIHNSRVTAAPDLAPVQGSFRSYLGRPWQQYSRTVFLQTYLDGLIDGAGWLEWSGGFALSTLYYGEYRNTGPGSSTDKRVQWSGHRVITDPATASRFTPGEFISGNSWLPSTGVPFTSGL